jgi:tetratricopeptide (TPR) repeat protein
MAARVCLDHTHDYSKCIRLCNRALDVVGGDVRALPRAHLIAGMAYSNMGSLATNRTERLTNQRSALDRLHTVVDMDSRDALARFYLALELALQGQLADAETHVARSLELDAEQPYACVLLALLLTCQHNHVEALDVVREALVEHPSHYALQVVRLMIEWHLGLVDDAVSSVCDLLSWWREEAVTGGINVQQQSGGGSDRIRTSLSPPVMPYTGDTGTLRLVQYSRST